MGKYIYSLGNVGLWEASRPLLWPLVLGFYWKLGLDPLFFGKITAIVFSIGIIALTYIISARLFDKKTAWIASLFVSLSQTFFMFSGILHSEIPSAFLALIGIYFFVIRSYKYSGLFFGLAFMARFFQLFLAMPLVLLLCYMAARKNEPLKSLLNFTAFFLIPTIPYLILNFILYGSMFYPFFLQAFMVKYTGWVFEQPFYFYLSALVKENVLAVFSIFGLAFALRKYDSGKYALALAFIAGFIPYNFIAHKEMRFLIPVIPLLYMLASYGLVHSVGLLKKRKSLVLFSLLGIFIALSAPGLRFDSYEDNLDFFYDYVSESDVGNVWVSNPAFIAFSDKKVDELIYYPLYDSRKTDSLEQNAANANLILINTCDIQCPEKDESCNNRHSAFIGSLKRNFSLEGYAENGQCIYYIFKKVYN